MPETERPLLTSVYPRPERVGEQLMLTVEAMVHSFAHPATRRFLRQHPAYLEIVPFLKMGDLVSAAECAQELYVACLQLTVLPDKIRSIIDKINPPTNG